MGEQDAHLVQRALAGEKTAFEALVAAHMSRAQAVARAVLGDQAAVDDVVQDAFLRAYERLGQLSEPATFPGWLSVIVHNEAVTWLRRFARGRAVRLTEAGSRTAPEEAPTDNDGSTERMRSAFARLPEDYRIILSLKYEADCDYVKIAETLDLSLANVEKRLYRARQALLKLLGPEPKE